MKLKISNYVQVIRNSWIFTTSQRDETHELNSYI